jgi:hypothetical protein
MSIYGTATKPELYKNPGCEHRIRSACKVYLLDGITTTFYSITVSKLLHHRQAIIIQVPGIRNERIGGSGSRLLVFAADTRGQ